MNPARLLLSIFLFVLAFSAVAANTEIGVHPNAHALLAPDGCQYQWFKNKHPMVGENNNCLQIQESGVYAVEVKDESGQITRREAIVLVTAAGTIVKIYIIGDSTVCNYAASAYPMMGWGQMIGYFFNKANVTIENRAIGGRSSRSFYEEGRWTPIRDALKTGDFVFIQFGHNDRDTKPERYTSTTDYKKFLTNYINDTRAKGAFPVLITPMVMNAWRNGVMRNVFTESGNDYRGAMLEVATSLQVPLVDLNMKSWNLFKELGFSYLERFVYHTYPAGEYPNYPTGNSDGTHFKISGATDNARLVVEGLKELSANTAIHNSLLSNLEPVYTVSTSSNLKGADSLLSRSTTYPAGIEATVKVVPKTSARFLNWNNAAGKSVGVEQKYIFTMGSEPLNFMAQFRGGTVTSIEEEEMAGSENTLFGYPNPFSQEILINFPGAFNYTIYKIDGTFLEMGEGFNTLIAGKNLLPGIYLIKIQNEKTCRFMKIDKQ